MDSWLYGQAGLWGSSQSSALKTWTATGINLVSSFLPVSKVGNVVRMATAASTTPMKVSAAEEENYSEVG